jgi:Transposase, Mutator family
VFFDALRVKIRDEGLVRNKAVHIALGVRADGRKQGGPRPVAGAERGGEVLAAGDATPRSRLRADPG